jgi:uncharacterized protein (DUF433 family)
MLEGFGLEEYKAGRISKSELRRLFGFETRYELDGFLKSEIPGGPMNTPDWSQCLAVESVPGRLNGAWVFRASRLPVSTVFENLEDGATVGQISEWFDIGKEQVIEVLAFAARSLKAPTPPIDAN